MSATISAFIKFLTPAVTQAANKVGKLSRSEKITLNKAANKAAKNLEVTPTVAVKNIKAAAKLKKSRTQAENDAGAGNYKPKKPNPKRISDPGNVAPKDRKKLARLKESQDLDDAGIPLKSGKEMMTKEQRLNSNQLELDAGAGSGRDVASRIKDGRAITRDQAKEFDEIVAKESSGFQIKKYGGKVKRNMGGKVKRNMGGKVTPRKKTVFRRGGGKALRGMGKATYSNKMY
jgi:hypothetical protein